MCVIYVNPDIDIEKEADYENGDKTVDKTVADIFSNIVGNKIKDSHIQTTDSVDRLRDNIGFEDGDFNENQGSFITRFDIIFEEDDRICFENSIDLTLIHYDDIA
ncbi:hypothetical protein HG461_003515 [Candidatus Saccharibacteria bacterium]|nr:hypothetical protein [Candidatus Saccharibacteria bacterium]